MKPGTVQLTTSSLPRWAGLAVSYITAKGWFGIHDEMNQILVVGGIGAVAEGVSFVKSQMLAAMNERGIDSFGEAFGIVLRHYLGKCMPDWMRQRMMSGKPPDVPPAAPAAPGGAP